MAVPHLPLRLNCRGGGLSGGAGQQASGQQQRQND